MRIKNQAKTRKSLINYRNSNIDSYSISVSEWNCLQWIVLSFLDRRKRREGNGEREQESKMQCFIESILEFYQFASYLLRIVNCNAVFQSQFRSACDKLLMGENLLSRLAISKAHENPKNYDKNRIRIENQMHLIFSHFLSWRNTK